MSGLWTIGRRVLIALLRFILAALMCFSPLTSIVVLGWLVRHMRRSFMVAAAAPADDLQEPPRLLMGAPFSRNPLRRYLGGLWQNLQTGLTALIPLAAYTLPYASLWLWAWWAGWNNSFAKGYEQAFVGPLVGLLGVAVFLALAPAMQLALVRFAVTQDWRTGLRLTLLWRLLFAHWRIGLALALLVMLASIPLFLHQLTPIFMAVGNREIASLQGRELEAVQFWYRWIGCAYLVAALMLLKNWLAGRYVRVLQAGLRTGLVDGAALHPLEQQSLARLGAQSPAARPLTRVKRALQFSGFFLASSLLWFAVVVQVFVGQFFNHAWAGWVIQPLFSLPWLPWPR